MLNKPLIRLLFTRHGLTPWNGEGRCLGRTDLPLCNEGKSAVRDLANSVNLDGITAVYSSPALRTIETARILMKNLHIKKVEIRDELLEIKWPDIWEGCTWSEIVSRYTDSYEAFASDPAGFSLDESESLSQVQARMVGFYRELLARHEGGAVLVVGHGGSLQVFLCYLFNVRLGPVWAFDLRPASISEIVVYPEGPVLRLLSYTSHFEPSSSLSRSQALQ